MVVLKADKIPICQMNILGYAAVAMRMPSMTEPSEYVLEPIREGAG
jgi:hypothetical protein